MPEESIPEREGARPGGALRAVPDGLCRLAAFNGGSPLVLRLFLGVTFVFAGIQKLASSTFLNLTAPGSFNAQLHAAITTSPLHHLLDPATHAPTLIAVLISAGEIAVGLGTLAGVLGRVAATGGLLLSLSFFVTVSYNDNPYYYGSDIVFIFAWTVLIIGGPGELSLGRFLRRPGTAAVAQAQDEDQGSEASAVPSVSAATEGGSGPRRLLALLRGTDGGPQILLRAFLGATFVFAGMQKLSSHTFFTASAPGSFNAQLHAAISTSPLHHLLDPATHATVLVAVLVSFGEIAVGLGTLLGLFGRVAAAGGMLLSLSFFLTVSYNDNPYYYGADIVFLLAWTVFVIGGSGAWSLDALIARRATRALAEVTESRTGKAGAAARRRRLAEEIARREVLERASAAGAVATGGLVLGGLGALVGHSVKGSGNPSGSTVGTLPAGTGKKIGLASSVPVGGAAQFTDPTTSQPAFAVQPTPGKFLAFSAICTHQGCQVVFDKTHETFDCPCHGSIFDAKTGSVIQGPAISPLPSIPIKLGPDGALLVD